MKDEQSNVRQHARLAMGKSIGHPAGAGRGYRQGGVVSQQSGKPEIDKTEYQKYGNGFRKIRGK